MRVAITRNGAFEHPSGNSVKRLGRLKPTLLYLKKISVMAIDRGSSTAKL
jgi:hypothetical protein